LAPLFHLAVFFSDALGIVIGVQVLKVKVCLLYFETLFFEGFKPVSGVLEQEFCQRIFYVVIKSLPVLVLKGLQKLSQVSHI